MISPLDDRYYDDVKCLVKYFGDDAYTIQRINVEIRHFIEMSRILKLDINYTDINFRPINSNDIEKIKNYEKITNHDVKAIEYFLRDYLKEHIVDYKYDHLIHIGLTSQDINSVAFSCNLKNGSFEIVKIINNLLEVVKKLKMKCVDIKMVARTHGQPAIEMNMDNMIQYYYERINKQLTRIIVSIFDITAKFGGAVGNHNALKFILPAVDWNEYSDNIVKIFGLIRNKYTTQIDSYDSYCNLLNDFKQLSIIIKDMNLNLWNYIKDKYFIQTVIKTETGSSTMPQKINPIDFENSLGQIEMFIGMVESITRSLSYSNYQRDIKDSTILRSFGETLGKFVIALKKTIKGISKLEPNKEFILEELNNHPEILMENIQTYLRFKGIDNAYEIIKEFSRGNNISKENIKKYIVNLDINIDKNELLSLLIL